MKQKNKMLRLSFWMCFLLLITSCGDGERVPAPLPPEQIDMDISSELTVRIYIDATVSMKGFVAPVQSTYVQVLSYLESVVTVGWRNGKVKFYQFGTQVLPLTRAEFIGAKHSTFYDNRAINQETLIQKVMDQDQADGLTVIVTDLFQDKEDVNIVVSQLKEKYIRSNRAIGVIGIRSQYDGTIFDIGINVPPIRYRTGPEPESFRPFYLMILGKHADVVHYFEQLKPGKFSDKFVILSRHLMDPLITFDKKDPITGIDNLLIVRNLINSEDNRVKQFRVLGNPEKAGFEANLTYTPLPYTVLFKPDDLEAEVNAEQYQNNGFEKSEKAKQCFVISQIALSATDEAEFKLTFEAKLTPRSLPGDGIFRYEVILRPKASAYPMPDWCSAWDMGTARDGSKTLNLNRFLSNLWQATFQMHEPKVAKFYCYIKK